MAQPKVDYSLAAERDLTDLFNWIAADSGPQRADAILTRIERTAATLAATPRLGRLRRDLDNDAIRSFAVYPWLILYKPLPDGGIIPLTKHDQDIEQGKRDRPAEEVVTTAMIRAGVQRLSDLLQAETGSAYVVEEVYRAMASVDPAKRES